MRCTAVDLGQLQIATLALHASLNQTATTDLRVALLSANPMPLTFPRRALALWLGIEEQLLEPISHSSSSGLRPSFVVADDLIISDSLLRPCLAGFRNADLPRVAMVLLLSAFLDAAANALPVLVAQRLGSQSSVPPVGEFIDLTTCRCAPSSAFANRQCRAVIAALNGPLKPG